MVFFHWYWPVCQISLTGTTHKSRLCSNLNLMFAVWDERSCELSTLFDEHMSDPSNIICFWYKNWEFINWRSTQFSHYLIKSGKFEILFLYLYNNGIRLVLISFISNLIFFYLDADVVNESIDECHQHSVQSVTILTSK